MATISVTAGSTVAWRRVARSSPGLTMESAGATESWTANTKMRSVPEHELRDREPDERDHRDQRVREPPFRERRQRRQNERDRDVEEECEGGEKQRVLRARADRRRDGLVVYERTAEVAACDAGDPVAVPLPDRLVELQVIAKDLTLLLGGLATEHAFGDVTREDAREEIDERRHDRGACRRRARDAGR